MKRLLLILLSVTLVMTMLVSCNTAADTSDEKNTNNKEAKTFADFNYKNTAIKIGSDSKDIVNKLGEPLKTESFDAGCGDSTPGYIYAYSGFEIRTNPVDGVDTVDKIVILSDLVSTTEGAHIGMKSSEITKIYGEPSAKSEEIIRYTNANTILQFDLNSEKTVISITYKPTN